jgi:excisionase family DNA binding protein
VVTGRPLLAASVSGAPAWILWQVSREALQLRIRQFERDPYVNPQVVRDLRATAAGLEEAARQYRELVDRSRSVVADSVEVPRGGSDAGLGNLPNRWVDVGEAAMILGCSKRWVTALIQQGRVVAAKHGREWRIDPSSVEDFKLRGANAA